MNGFKPGNILHPRHSCALKSFFLYLYLFRMLKFPGMSLYRLKTVHFVVFIALVTMAWLFYGISNPSANLGGALTKKQFVNIFVNPPRPEQSKLVLIYTEFYYGGLPWKGLKDSNDFKHFKGNKCPVSNCNLTYNKGDFLKSNVVIFHAYNMPSSQEIQNLTRRRPKGQIWVYFNLENPIVTTYIAPLKHRRDLDGVFNWTMTFLRDSDIYHPYGFYLPREQARRETHAFTLPDINHAKEKDKFAVWTESGCGQIVDERKLRLLYIHYLRKLIPIDVYGACANAFHQPNLEVRDCPQNAYYPSPECKTLLQRYKFFLAFENMNCEDYITEKYWCTPLDFGIIPVVMGGANYKALAIPGSYIDVQDFSSQKELAQYLMYLDKNDTAYNEYFNWKKHYKSGGCLRVINMADHYPWMCDICSAANNHSMEKKAYDRIADFFDPAKRCGVQYSRLNEIVVDTVEKILKKPERVIDKKEDNIKNNNEKTNPDAGTKAKTEEGQ